MFVSGVSAAGNNTARPEITELKGIGILNNQNVDYKQ